MIAVGFGNIYVWQGGSLWIGQSFRGAPHSHHGIQIGLALEGVVSFESGGRLREYELAIIPSKLTHALDGGGRLAAQIFVEPESVEGRILIEKYLTGAEIASVPIGLVSDSAARLLSHYLAKAGEERLVGDARALIGDLTNGSQPRTVTDPRILTAIESMRSRLDTAITLRSAAALAHLSPGRFRHLFVQETGTPLRTYLIWLRMSTAVDAIARGATVTEAAYLAGFSDSAHLTRMFRRMFGAAPTALKIDRQPAATSQLISPRVRS